MPDISKITLPSGNTYNIKDAVAREAISGGITFIVAWNGSSTPVVADIPAGVVVTYNGTTYTGTLAANNAQVGAFYLVASSTTTSGSPLDVYDEYVPVGTTGSKAWEKIGDTQVDLNDVVRSVNINNTSVTPDENGSADITYALGDWLSNQSSINLGIIGATEDNVTLYGPNGQPIPFTDLYYAYSHAIPTYAAVPMGNDGYQVYTPVLMYHDTGSVEEYGAIFVNYNFTTNSVKTARFTSSTNSGNLTGRIFTTPIISGVTFNKETDVALGESTTFTNSTSAVTFSGGSTDVALGENTTFALTSGSVTHGTPSTDEVLGVGTTFNVTDPTINLGGTTKYLSASASGGGTAWNSKDQKTVVTGYASPTTDTFVKSVTAETNKNLVTTTVPNVTGNTSVSIPNVTGNTSVSIPNVTNVGSASTWSFTMGSGDNAETLIIGGANSVAPTLGANLTATNTTLGTALSASKVTLGTAITVATGATSTTGTGDAVVTGVTVGDSATAITALGTASTANVIGASSTFTNTQPSVTLTANAASGTGRITYLEAASPTASGGAVSPVTSGAGSDKVTAITAMPTSTVGTAITVGTNDKVTAVTNIGTGTAAAQTITVGANDKITVLTDATSIATD